MKIGIIKEIKAFEHRIMLTPNAVGELVDCGNEIYIESGAGSTGGFDDKEYESAGASIFPTSEKVFAKVELIIKLQAPMPIEYELLNDQHICFTYDLPQRAKERLQALQKSSAIFLSGELIKTINHSISELTGRIAIFQAAKYLEKDFGGKGILLSGGSGIPGATVTILGDNTIAFSAAEQALANSARVNLIGEDYDKVLAFKPRAFSENLQIFEYDRGLLNTIFLETDALIAAGRDSDLPSDIHIQLKDLKLLKQGSVIIDLTIDKHHLIQTSRQTKPTEPIYINDGLVFFTVNNLTSMLPKTASQVLSNAVLPYIKQLSQIGFHEMIATNPAFRNSLVIYRGKIVHPILTDSQEDKSYDILELLELNI